MIAAPIVMAMSKKVAMIGDTPLLVLVFNLIATNNLMVLILVGDIYLK
jgi:hypothetical protein